MKRIDFEVRLGGGGGGRDEDLGMRDLCLGAPWFVQCAPGIRVTARLLARQEINMWSGKTLAARSQLLTAYCAGGDGKNWVGWECSTCGGEERCARDFGGET